MMNGKNRHKTNSKNPNRIKMCKDLSFENQEKLATSLLIDKFIVLFLMVS